MRSRKDSPAAEVALRDRDDEPEVGLDHVLLRAHVAALDSLGERDLLIRGQERHLADLAEVEPERVERRLDREVELGRDLVVLRGRLLLRERLVLDAFDQLDRVVDQVRVEVLDLLLRELDLVETDDDLVVREEPSLETVLDEAVELLDVGKGDVDGQHEPGFLLSRSNGYRPTELHEPVPLPHRPFRPQRANPSPNVAVSGRSDLDEFPRGSYSAGLADDLAARVLQQNGSEAEP